MIKCLRKRENCLELVTERRNGAMRVAKWRNEVWEHGSEKGIKEK